MSTVLIFVNHKCANYLCYSIKVRSLIIFQIEHDFLIDMRTFRNFEFVKEMNFENSRNANEIEIESLSEQTLIVTEHVLSENQDFLQVSTALADFLSELCER